MLMSEMKRNVAIIRNLSVAEFANEFGGGHCDGGIVTLKSGKVCGAVKAGSTVALATSEEVFNTLKAGQLSAVQCVLVDDRDNGTQYWRLCRAQGMQDQFSIL